MAAPKLLLASGLFLVLVACVSSRIGFSPNTEYKYEYVAQVRTGLPDVGKDKNVVGLRSIITVQTDGNDLLVQLNNVQSYNGKVIDQDETNGEIKLEYVPQSRTEFTTPFKILFQGNTDELKGIEVNQNEPTWSVDIKKALGIMFNVRLDQQLSRRQGYFASQPHASYEPISVVESGLEGKCMSKYIYQQLPWPGSRFTQVLNVTKVRDYLTCEDSTSWLQTIHEPLKCTDCASGKARFMNWGRTSRYNVYEDNGKHFIEKAEFQSAGDITPSPPKGDSIRLVQYARLSLISSGRSTGSIRYQGQGIQHHNMGIVPADANLNARFKRYVKSAYGTKGTPLNEKLGQKEESTMEKVQKQLPKLFQLIDDTPNIVDNNALNSLSYLVEKLRLLTVDEIAQIYRQFQDHEQKKKLLLDAITMTGTDASIIFIKNLLEQKQITGEYAAQIISSIPAYVLEPQPAILEEIWALCKARLMKENRQVYVTTLLTFGELVNQACVPKGVAKTTKPYHIKVAGCPHTLTTRYLQELMTLFEQSNEYWEKSAIMYSIYRMGLNETLDAFVPYFQHKMFNLPSGLRAEMLIGLFEVGPGRQDEVYKYIMPIFYNSTLTTLERIMAFEVLAYTTTSQMVINELAMSTWHETNHQVATYIYSYLYNNANLKTTCWADMSTRSQEALKLAKPVKYGILDSFLDMRSAIDERHGIAAVTYAGAVQSDESLIPKSVYFFLGQELGGYYLSLLEVFTVNDGMQKLADHIIGPKGDFLKYSLKDLFKYKKDARETNPNTIKKDGNIKVNYREDEPVSTRIMVSYFQNRHRLFFIDENTLNDIRNSGLLPPTKDFVTNLRDGIPINYQKALMIHDYHIKFASIIGLPITIAFKMPAYINVRGKLSVDVAQAGSPAHLSSISIKPEIEINVAAKGWSIVEVGVPYEKIVVAASATKKLFFSEPIYGSLHLDVTQRSLEASLRKPDNAARSPGPVLAFKAEMMPALSTYDLTTGNKVVQVIRSAPANTQTHVTKQSFGIPFSVKVTKDVPLDQTQDYQRSIKKMSLLQQLTFWWAPKTFSYHSIEVTKNPQEADTDRVELKMQWSSTASSLKKELWFGKSPLQRLRFWNLFPEWEEFPLACNAAEQYRGLTSTPEPKKSGFFSRVKDRFKSAFGRSGGSDDDDNDDDDDNKDDDKKKKDKDDDDSKEDRGRALHPHIATRPAGTTRPSSGSAQYGSPTTGTQYAGSGSQYGGASEGSQHGGSSGYGGQSRSSGAGGYSQTQYGSGPGAGGQSQYGQTTSDNTDWEQKPGGWEQTSGNDWEQKQGGHDDWEQKPGGGGGGGGHDQLPAGGYGQPGSYGQQAGQQPGGYGQQPGGFGQQAGGQPSLYSENKSKVYQFPLNEDKSQTNIYVQINTIGSVKREIAADISFNSNSRDGSKQSSVSVTATNVIPGRKNFKICYTKNYYDGLRGQCTTKGHTNPNFNAKITWGDKCDSGSHITLAGTYDTEPEQYLIDVRKRQNTIEPGEYLLILNNHRNVLTKAKYDVTFSQPTQMMLNASSIFDNYLKCYLSKYLTEDTIGAQNPQGKVTAEFHYELEKPLLDIRVRKPKETIVFENVHYPSALPFLFPRTKDESFAHQLANVLSDSHAKSECRVGFDGHIKTFNRLKYNYTASECPYVIAKDCSPSEIFTVTALVGHNRKVTIDILEHRIEIKVAIGPKRIEFLVDGQQAVAEEGKLTFIRSEGVENKFLAYVANINNEIVVKSPPLGLVVTITEAAITTRVSKFWKGKVCGICGEFNERQDKTFFGPNKCLYGDPQTFVNSYQIPNPLCPQVKSYGQGQCLPTASQTNKDQFPVQHFGEPSPDDLFRGPCYLQTHKMFRRFGKKVCFTTEPVRQCSPTCVKQDPEIVQYSYKCFQESSKEATDLMAAVSLRPLSELKGVQPDGTSDETVPKACLPTPNYY